MANRPPKFIEKWPDIVGRFTDVEDTQAEIYLETESGERYHELNIAPLRNKRGQLNGRLLVLHNITERVLAEKKLESQQAGLEEMVRSRTAELDAANRLLRESEEKYRRLVENAKEAILVAQDGQLKCFNAKTIELTGFDPDELAELPFTEILHPEERSMVLDRYARRLRGEDPDDEYSFRIIDKSGNIRWAEIRAVLIDWQGNPAVLAFISEITQRKLAEEAQEKYAEQLKILHIIDKTILEANSSGAVAEAFLENVQKLVKFDRASITLFDLETGQARLLAVKDHMKTTLPTDKDFQVNPLYIETLKEGKTQYYQDIASTEMANPTLLSLKTAGLRAVVNAPLFYDSDLIGSLNIAGDLPAQYSQSDIDIINMVATQLAIAIRQARLFEQIQGHSAELEQRVRERTSELTKANQRLLALSKIKDEFVANVSHELRTPITSLKLFHELITEQPE